MTCSTIKRLTEPLNKPEREFQRHKRAALRSHQNESLAIARRNLFDDEASSSNNTGPKLSTPPKTLHEHSCPTSSSFQNPITIPIDQTGIIVDSRDITTTPHHRGMANVKEKGRMALNGLSKATINKSETPKPEASTFAITTRLGISTQDPPFPALPRPATDNFTEGETEKEGPEGTKPSITQEPTPRPSILYHPSKTSNLPFPSRLKNQKKDDEDERLLLIFKQIHINLPFLKAMIHMPKGAKVLKDLLSHKEKLKKAASSVKLIEEYSAIIQRNMSQKEGDPKSFTLPCLIGPLAVKNALTDLGASINLMPHSLFRLLGISELKPTKMNIRLADWSIKYPIGVCENLLVKVGKLIFLVNFVILEMDKDELVLIILGRPFLATAMAMINEQWVNTVNHDGKWTEDEEEEDFNKALAVSFYPRTEPVEPLEWKAPENRSRPSSMEPPNLELKELPKNLEYAFLQENNQLLVVISSALSTDEKTSSSRFFKIIKEKSLRVLPILKGSTHRSVLIKSSWKISSN
ncbi:reverse transcriptase domain-containing protein [Tanacetum coccineum]